MRLAVAILIGVLLASAAEASRCPRPCKKLFRTQLKSCVRTCAKGKEGRDCRSACRHVRKERVAACKVSQNPTPPACGLPPVITPATTTSSTTVTSTSSTLPSTTSTLCVRVTCAAAGKQCGAIDDGCGGMVGCGPCPATSPICIDGSCRDSCAGEDDGTGCDRDGDLCTVDKCANGTCLPSGTTRCSAADPCYSAIACNPATGSCEQSGYAGEGSPCPGPGGVEIGVCAAARCAVGKACAIDGIAYADGELVPDGSCRSCRPEISRTVAIPIPNGLTCAGGVCVGGACSGDVCSILGRITAPGTLSRTNSCVSCQPASAATLWSPVSNGTPCTGGLCVDGTCKSDSCVIGGSVHANLAFNPSNPCEQCVVTKSRTSWTTLPDDTICGRGCLSGFCKKQFLGCAFFGSTACAPTDCGAASCDAGTGECRVTPANVGGPCTRGNTNACLASQGTCDSSGNCLLPARTGDPCVPALQPPPTGEIDRQVSACQSTTEGTCDATARCVGKILPVGTACELFGGSGCGDYTCHVNLAGGANTLCSATQNDPCPKRHIGCGEGTCDEETDVCMYAPHPNGTTRCTNDGDCCPGQLCLPPSNCGAFCISRFCFYPGSN